MSNNQNNQVPYFGSKLISAQPMLLGEYNEYRGWVIPSDESPNREGYLTCQDEHVSWIPKEVFEKIYRKIDNLTFGHAIEALKQGKLVARKGWNGKSMFIFIRPADTLTTSFIPNVKSLPKSVKEWIDENIDDKVNPGEQGLQDVHFGAYICMKAADNSIVNGWLASQTDILAEDWVILDY